MPIQRPSLTQAHLRHVPEARVPVIPADAGWATIAAYPSHNSRLPWPMALTFSLCDSPLAPPANLKGSNT